MNCRLVGLSALAAMASFVAHSELVSRDIGDPEMNAKFQLFDGKVMLQPTIYRNRNLYRGGLLNMKRLGERGAFDVNLMWVNQVVPVAFDVDRPIFDNFPEFLASPESARRAATVARPEW